MLTISTTTLNGFTYKAGNGPSAEQSFSISGSNLTGDIIIAPPADYEISTATGASFIAMNPVILTESNGVTPNTIIYSRLKHGLTAGNYNENITITSAGTGSTTIACTGNATANASVTLTDITDPTLSTVQGTSVFQTLNISGVNLSNDLELAISGTDAGLFSLSQYSVVQTGGIVPNTIVTITYSPNTQGYNTATLTLSSDGAVTVARTLNGIATVATDIHTPIYSLVLSVENNHILFMANAGEIIEIYNSIGQKLIQKPTVDGINAISVTAHGLLLVKVGTRVGKVIL